jgi:hypothetical protein
MLSWIKNQLLSLPLKEEVLKMNFWTTAGSAEVESPMNDIVAEIKKHKDNVLSEIHCTIKEAVSEHKR